jgi:DNA gyrase subunit A
MICINKEDKSKTVLVVSEKGYGKRTKLDDPETGEANYRITNRGGKGVKTMNVTEKTGHLVGLLAVTEQEDLMITCVSGVTIRMSVKAISELGRATQGVKLIKVDEGDSIAAITQLDEMEEEVLETEISAENAAETVASDSSIENPETPTEPTESSDSNEPESDSE